MGSSTSGCCSQRVDTKPYIEVQSRPEEKKSIDIVSSKSGCCSLRQSTAPSADKLSRPQKKKYNETLLEDAFLKEIFSNVDTVDQGRASPNDRDMIEKCFSADQKGLLKCFAKGKVRINSCDEWGATALYTACAMGHTPFVQFLIKNKANVNCSNKFSEVERGHKNSIRVIQPTMKMTPRTGGGVSPLLMATQNGYAAIVSILIKNKADVNIARKEDGVTPLFMACRQGHRDCASLLVTANSSINFQVRGLGKATSLYVACEVGHRNIVSYLVNEKADVRTRTDRRFTPLLIACHNAWRDKQEHIIKLLIDRGAVVNAGVKMNKVFITPLKLIANMRASNKNDIALQLRLVKIKDMLTNAGAGTNAMKSIIRYLSTKDMGSQYSV